MLMFDIRLELNTSPLLCIPVTLAMREVQGTWQEHVVQMELGAVVNLFVIVSIDLSNHTLVHALLIR